LARLDRPRFASDQTARRRAAEWAHDAYAFAVGRWGVPPGAAGGAARIWSERRYRDERAQRPATGPEGPKGATGANGVTGATGPAGGRTGPTGVEGPPVLAADRPDPPVRWASPETPAQPSPGRDRSNWTERPNAGRSTCGAPSPSAWTPAQRPRRAGARQGEAARLRRAQRSYAYTEGGPAGTTGSTGGGTATCRSVAEPPDLADLRQRALAAIEALEPHASGREFRTLRKTAWRIENVQASEGETRRLCAASDGDMPRAISVAGGEAAADSNDRAQPSSLRVPACAPRPSALPTPPVPRL
jgi:hypothetical protein